MKKQNNIAHTARFALLVALSLCLCVAKTGADESEKQTERPQVNAFEKMRFLHAEQTAAAGDAKSQYYVGWQYFRGNPKLGVEQDFTKAAEWLDKAAKQKNKDAMFFLSLLYLKGNGIEQDEQKAVDWMRKYLNSDIAMAQYAIARLYQDGKPEFGIEKDTAQAAAWHTKAAEQNQKEAMYCLGVLYLTGDGVEKDEAKAAGLVEAAASPDNQEMLYWYGNMLVAQSLADVFAPEKALDYYKRAARAETKPPHLAQRRLHEIKTMTGFAESNAPDDEPRYEALWIAQMYTAANNRDKAIEFLDKAEKAGVPKNRILYETAILHTQLREFDKARALANRLCDQYPDDADSHVLRFGISQAEHRIVKQPANPALFANMDKAIAALRRILGDDSFVPPLFESLRDEQRYKYEDAEKFFTDATKKAASDNRRFMFVLRELIRTASIKNSNPVPIDEALCTLTENPCDAESSQTMASYLWHLESELLIKSLFTKSRLYESRKDPLALNNFAWAKFLFGQFAEAEKLVRESLEKTPNEYGAWDTLAWVLIKTDRLDEAEIALTKETAQIGSSRDVTYAMLHFKKNEFQKAREYLDKIFVPENLDTLSRWHYDIAAEIKTALDAQDSGTPAE